VRIQAKTGEVNLNRPSCMRVRQASTASSS